MKLKTIAVSLILVALVNPSSAFYEIILDRTETLLGDDDRFIRFEGLRIKKFNRTTHVLNGKFNLLHPIDDSIVIEVVGSNWQGNQYKQVFSKRVDGACSFLKSSGFEAHYNDFLAHLTNPWKYGDCPIQTGPNELINFTSEDTFLPPYLPGSEKWLLELKFSVVDDYLGGYKIYCLLRNEQSLLNG